MTPTNLWRRAVGRIRKRDPEYDAARRALRAALVIPIAAAVSFTVGGGSQTPLFTIFGLDRTADRRGLPRQHERPRPGLWWAGLQRRGADQRRHPGRTIPWLAVTLMFVVGVLISFAGLLSEIVAAGQRATLLTFVLPVCTPVGPLPERLLGWLIAVLICVPAALFVFPRATTANCGATPPRCARHWPTGSRARLGRRRDRRDGRAAGQFPRAAYRPVALTAGSRALVRVVDDLQWLCDRVTGETGGELGPMAGPGVAVLRDCARILHISRPAERSAARTDLGTALAVNRLIAVSSYRDDIVDILAEPDDGAAIELGAPCCAGGRSGRRSA